MNTKKSEFKNAKQTYEHKKWLYELNRAIAERDHDFELKHGLRLNEAAINNGNLIARALLIINGGAAIAVLAFIGRLIPSNKPENWLIITPLIDALMWFAWGVAMTAIAMAFAYFTNYCNSSVSYARDRFYEHPYIRENDKSRRWMCLGITSQCSTLIFAGSAIVLFVLGIFEMDGIIEAFQ